MPFVVANGVRTYYESAGAESLSDRPALLLIAGNGMDHTTFRDQTGAFGRHFRCITYDMRGVGQSDVTTGGYDIRTMAADAFGLLDALGVGAAHVAGYSLGGAIGLEMALGAPKRVASLSLYSAYSHVAPYLRRRYDLLIKILEESTPEMWAMFSTFSAFGEEYINANDAALEAEVKLRTARWQGPNAPSKPGLLGHYRAILSHDVLDRLDKIACPTWIGVGSSDPVTPPSYSRLMHERIRGSVLRIYPGAPHRLLNFTPEFTQEALAFLIEHRG
jgi:3-oxoadipate enol-lactonase